MRNTGLDEAQAGIKIAWENINNFRYANDTTLMEESEEDLKSLLMKVKEESKKVGLKLNIQWSKPERKTPIQYTNAYIWNLEKAEEPEIKLPTLVEWSKK